MDRFRARSIIASLLVLGTVPACNCDNTQTFVPGAVYVPSQVLDFGNVAVSSEKTLLVKVTSNGGAGLKISSAAPSDPGGGKWRTKVPDVFTTGLTPGRTSSISVTYRPCPDAWNAGTGDMPGTTLKPDYKFDQCSANADTTNLVVVDNTTKKGITITLSGQPVQPASISVKCQNGMTACNQSSPQLLPCVGMVFGNVSSGSTPCDMVVEVHDSFRNMNKPVGDLVVERIDITVQDINTLPNGVTHNGEEVGFEVLDTSGNKYAPTTASPLVVKIAEGKSDGSSQFKIRFSGTKTGSWYGSNQYGMTGVRLYTNDPDNKIFQFNISGTGSAPNIEVFPHELNFGPVDQGRTKTLTATVTNAGDADLRIDNFGFMNDTGMTKFKVVAPTKGAPPFMVMPNQSFPLKVSYSPNAAGTDSDVLQIGSNDALVMGKSSVPVSGGAVPKIKLSPPDTLTFPIPNPPTGQPRSETLVIQNVGFGDLQVTSLEIVGPQGMMTESVGDFSINECMGMMMCAPNLTLCPPSSPSCMNAQSTFTVTYQNHDISETDYAELHVHSNDPADPDHTIVLAAHDVPCFPPNPIIRLNPPTQRPCKGRAVTLDGSMSMAMGTGPMSRITAYNWSFSFTPPPTPPINGTGAMVSFTPQAGGVYILNLDATNDCGAMSQTSGSETINVADTCN